MNYVIKLSIYSLLLMSLWACKQDGAQNGQTSEGWTVLDGSNNLEGWKKLNGEAGYRVEDGVIIGTTKANTPNTFLATEQKYSDFILEYEFKVDPAINSGVQIRSNSFPEYQEGRVHGYQVEIDPSERAFTAGIYDEARRGWLYPLSLNELARKAFRQNEWNKVYVECIGNTIKTWLNDVPAAYLVDDETDSGFIALQVHSVNDDSLAGKEVSWRNIRVKTEGLEPREGDFPYVVNMLPNQATEKEKEMGWALAWDGKTADGWRGAHKESFPEEGWTIEDGQLIVLESGGEKAGTAEISLPKKSILPSSSNLNSCSRRAPTAGSSISSPRVMAPEKGRPSAWSTRSWTTKGIPTPKWAGMETGRWPPCTT